MKRLLEFLKQNPLVVKWTAWYFFALWFVLRFVFKFDMFSGQYWWKFIHGHFHGFWPNGVLPYNSLEHPAQERRHNFWPHLSQ